MDVTKVQALFVCGRIPRRAVLTSDGQIAERTSSQQLELHVVSELCELLRSQCGHPVYPRHSVDLIKLCLNGTDFGAWTILHSDLTLGDCLDWAAVKAHFEAHSYDARRLVCALTQATSADQLKVIMECIGSVVTFLPPAANEAAARALVSCVRELVAVFTEHCKFMLTADRDNALASLGKLFITTKQPPTEELSELFVEAVMSSGLAADDTLRFFMYAPVEPAILCREDIVDTLLSKALKVPPTSRHTLLGLLSRCARAGCQGMQGRLEHIAIDTLRNLSGEVLDIRLMLCCSSILAKNATGDEKVKVLGSVLERVCLHLASISSTK